MRLITQQTDVDKLHDYLFTKKEVQLSPALEQKLERLERCDGLIRQHGLRSEVVRMMIEYYEKQDKSYSKRTAYNDYQETQELFNSGYRHDIRRYNVDLIVGEVLKTKRKAEALAEPDTRAMAACDANLIKINEKFFGETDKIDWSLIKRPMMVFCFDPALINSDVPVEKEKLDKLITKFKTIRKKVNEKPLVQDITWEDVK
ncbi:hypothetical protein BWI96_16755 [Siphonobacter sp. SORGH_AS_0500]|uniref:hypothetical protein n=1 Tax=Siphonobacter sp. SORGH_AS_0500 TaxID=1864824 RepID=UPI000CC10C3F|nr:hypothetical protein [Siphonobacter sp. SORGH_AS_0500]PKK35549.1 hypothetical protein BWI96_16755 [Siphonobacter sp. SORGH_AS_0500]